MLLPKENISQSTLADSVEYSILEYIRKENLKPGDQLPKEEDFSTGLNVSRNIIREGLSGLKSLGLIESRKKRGMILCRPNVFTGVSKLAQVQFFSPEENGEFMQIRAIMELGMIPKIWKKKTKESIKELWNLVEAPELPPTIEEEIHFHCKLFSLGGNYVANQFLHILVTSFSGLKPDPLEVWEEKHLPRHSDICNILENGTREDFFNIMEQHFSLYF